MKPITSFGDALLRDNVAESVKHAWYKGGKGPLHPYKGETVAEYTDFQENAQVLVREVADVRRASRRRSGPLARVLVAVGRQGRARSSTT